MNLDAKIIYPLCVLGICDGSGWIDLGNGQALACDCQNNKPETDFKNVQKRFVDQINLDILRATGNTG